MIVIHVKPGSIPPGVFFCKQKPLRHITNAHLAPPEIQVKIRFQSGFQALQVVDMRSHKLSWMKIVHNAVLQPELRWTPKAFKGAKPNWPPILEDEISGHKSEKASLTNVPNDNKNTAQELQIPGNRKPRAFPGDIAKGTMAPSWTWLRNKCSTLRTGDKLWEAGHVHNILPFLRKRCQVHKSVWV